MRTTSNAIRRVKRGTALRLTLLTLAMFTWLRADTHRDDRGSDSTEKAFSTLTAIAVGGAVAIGLGAYVAAKVGAF